MHIGGIDVARVDLRNFPLAESLVVDFIRICASSNDRDGNQIGTGALVALACFCEPTKVSELLSMGDEDGSAAVMELGQEHFKDICEARDVKDRVAMLLRGGSEETDEAVDEVFTNIDDYRTRTDVAKKIEEAVLRSLFVSSAQDDGDWE